MNGAQYARHMGALDKLRSLLGFQQRAAAVPAGYELQGGIVVATASVSNAPQRGTRELLQAYRQSPRLRAVVSRIARGVAALQVHAYVRTSEAARGATFARRRDEHGSYRDVSTAPAFRWGKDKGVRDLALTQGPARLRARRRRELAAAGLLREVADHPLLELLAAPNGEMSGRTLFFVTQIWLDLVGEAFWLITTDKEGKPVSLWPVPPHWVQQTPSTGAPHFAVSAGGVTLRVAPGNVVWFRDPNPENPYARGTGTGESLGDEIETDEYAAKYLKNWFFNSAMPSAVVSFEGATPAELKVMREKWEQEHRGYSNAHRVHFGMGKMNAVRLDASLRDQQMTELRAFSRDAMAQVFGVPPEMVGIIENSNRSTIDAAGYIYALGVEFPRADFLREELQRQLAPMYDASLALEVEVPIPDDETRRLDVLRAMPGAFDLNEWRAEAGYDPRAEFEAVFPPLAMPGQGAPSTSAPDAEEPAEEPEEPDDEDPAPTPPPPAAEAKSMRLDPPWASRGPFGV